jgi:N-acetyl-anhydromuramyl-L-alanine amidase AmpD
MVEISELTGFNPSGKSKNKKQIVLTHTSRNLEDYITALRFRYNGKYDRIPHFIITKTGEILQLLDTNQYSNNFDGPQLNKNIIVICLENLGWLKKNPLNSSYVNWIGDIYREGVYERKWRGHFFWEPYTTQQMESLKDLTLQLCVEYDIPASCIGHNVRVDGVEKFEGIVTRSNYTTDSTDLSPAFDFEDYKKIFENESV